MVLKDFFGLLSYDNNFSKFLQVSQFRSGKIPVEEKFAEVQEEVHAVQSKVQESYEHKDIKGIYFRLLPYIYFYS